MNALTLIHKPTQRSLRLWSSGTAVAENAHYDASRLLPIMALNIARVLNYTVFTFLSIILLCLVLLTPADAIYQCYITQRLTNIFIITGGYVVTFVLTVLIYATRIYTNRTVLAGIPKAWIPIEKEDVGKGVRRLVKEGLVRSAIIAYQARPRDTTARLEEVDTATTSPIVHVDGADDGHAVFADYESMTVDLNRPPWGHIEHPGWSSPSCPDLPDLPYRTVVQELPNLIEAKAVSLAPPDPILTSAATRHRHHHPFSNWVEQGEEGEEGEGQEGWQGGTIPDTRVVEILRRPASMGLREYFTHLTTLNVVNPPELGAEFLALYERARFSGRELYEAEFRELMHVFAEVLRGMQFQDPHLLEEIHYGTGVGKSTTRGDTESLIGPSDEEGETDALEFYQISASRQYESGPSGYYNGRGRSNSLRPVDQAMWESSGGRRVRGQIHSQAQAQAQTLRTPSMRSLRPVASNVSGSSGASVIRLVDTRESDLPYVIDRGDT